MATLNRDSEYHWKNWPEHDDAYPWLLSVDPGLNSCGWALWFDGQLVKVGVVKPRRSGTLGDRMSTILNAIGEGIAGHHTLPGNRYKFITSEPRIHCVIEMPHYQEGSAKGSFGWKTGDLQKLTLLVGFLAGHDWGAVTLATPRDWKGQLPKDVVIRRVTARLGKSRCEQLDIKADAWDAVGIGLWALTGKV